MKASRIVASAALSAAFGAADVHAQVASAVQGSSTLLNARLYAQGLRPAVGERIAMPGRPAR